MNRFNPHGTHARAISASMTPSARGGTAEFREVLADRQLQASAKAELGKLGVTLNLEDVPDDRRSMLARRADLRRAMNAVQHSYDRSKPATLTEDIVNTIDYLSAEIGLISNQLDLDEAAESTFSGRSKLSNALRDDEGRRIGTFFTNQALKDQVGVADSLGVARLGAESDIDIADFFRGVANMKTTEAVRNSLSVGTDTAGGYTLPSVLLPGILSALVPASSLLNAGASVAMLQGEGKSFRIAGIDNIPTAAWRSENGNIAESDATFRAIDVVPRSLAFRFKISRELLGDSQAGLEAALYLAIAGAFAKEMDRAGLRGTGTAPEIRGLKNIANINAVAFGGANGAAPTNYSCMVSAWKESTTNNAPAPTAAIMHPRDLATFANLADTTGQPLRLPPLLESMRFLQTSQIPTDLEVGSSDNCSEIYVGDFSQFVFFIREGVSVQVANELYAETGQIGFICHARVDVAAMYARAFTLITGIRPTA